MKTPIMDKYGLHPTGGYCTCFSSPYSKCIACENARIHVENWKNLPPHLRKQALAESHAEYPRTSNQDGR